MSDTELKRLTRSTTDRKWLGVCGGLGAYTGIDPVVFRVGVAVATFMGGAGVLGYLAAWLVMPDEGRETSPLESGLGFRLRDRDPLPVLAVAVVAVVILVGVFGPWAWHDGPARHGDWSFPYWLFVVGGVVWLIVRRRDRPPATSAAPVVATDVVDVAPQPPRSHRLFLLTCSVMLLTAGALAAVELSGAADLRVDVVLASLLLVVAAGLVLGAWFGRSRGLVAVGLVLTMATVGAAEADVTFAGAGERTWRPRSSAELRDEYRLGMGSAVLDLRMLPPLRDQREVEVDLGMGRLTVYLPSAGAAGDVDLPNSPEGFDFDVPPRGPLGLPDLPDDQDGFDLDHREVIDVPGPGRLVLDLHVGIGQLEVYRR